MPARPNAFTGAPQALADGLRSGTNITPRKDSRVVPFIHASRVTPALAQLPDSLTLYGPERSVPLSGLLFWFAGFALHSDDQDTL
jgi:hypothetical protein